jgi:hypothetical protein
MFYSINTFPTNKRNNICMLASSISSQLQRDMRPTHFSSNIFFNHFSIYVYMYLYFNSNATPLTFRYINIFICPTSCIGVWSRYRAYWQFQFWQFEDMIMFMPSFIFIIGVCLLEVKRIWTKLYKPQLNLRVD